MRTEKGIFKEFEKWGYVIDNNMLFCEIEHHHYKKHIRIDKVLKLVACFSWVERPMNTIINGTTMQTEYVRTPTPNDLSVWEFELLHELFTIWGWFDKGE